MDKDFIVLLAARASRLENQDAIDAAIVNMLADPKEVPTHTQKDAYSNFSSFLGWKFWYFLLLFYVLLYKWQFSYIQARANIQEVHFLPFNPVDKRTAITYIDSDGIWYRASKGAPEQVLLRPKGRYSIWLREYQCQLA